MNLIDGLDGLAAGIALIAATALFGVALMSGQVLLALFMAALGGALVGFLFFNFNPARIFLGDSGSLFLGPGTANLVIRNGRGEVVASRALTFVTVDGVVFTRALALLGGVEAPVDPANLAIGERGADFFIRFTAGERQDVEGREVISFPEPTPAVVLADERAFFTLETSRDFVHIEPVAVPTALAFTLAGSADARSISLFPGEASAVEFVAKAAAGRYSFGRFHHRRRTL